MDHHQYDIAIVGLGCAGSHIVVQMLDHPAFQDKSIIVFDDFNEDSLDKTWSFWEKGTGNWDHLLSDQWELGSFKTRRVSIDLQLTPYRYKKLQSREVIAFAKAKLQQHPNCTFVEAKVERIIETEVATLKTGQGSFAAHLVLDSRVAKEFFQDEQAITLKQHFLGWYIKTEKEVFDPKRFVMMDYRLQDPGTTSFIYILPSSTTEALVEFTYFSASTVKEAVYESYLEEYISTYLKAVNYSITQTEQGIIPMTTYRFDQHHTPLVHKIGTAGGWVKSSTGYSFKLSEKRAGRLINNYLTGKPLDSGMQKNDSAFTMISCWMSLMYTMEEVICCLKIFIPTIL